MAVGVFVLLCYTIIIYIIFPTLAELRVHVVHGGNGGEVSGTVSHR